MHHGGIHTSSFDPAWWLPGPHAQTLYPFLTRRALNLEIRRERLELPDGDFLDLDWIARNETASARVLILHGLEGSIRSHYAGGLMECLAKAGFRVGLLHFRGCSGEPNRLARSYHSGETDDLNWIVDKLLNRENTSPLALIGFSLGGNVVLKWLGERQEQCGIRCAAAVSVPFLLDIAARRLECGFSRVYQYYLLRKLHRSLQLKQQRISLPISIDSKNLNTFRRFDDAVTAPLHGFRGVDDYYHSASCLPYLRRITCPTLILQAIDDPFMTPAALPLPEQLATHVRLELSSHGGHVGFIGGPFPGRPVFWLEARLLEYLQGQMTV